MLRLATDADVNGAIVRGLRRHAPTLDLLRVQDVLPEGASDPQVLAWAAIENRVLISNDRNTMLAAAINQIESGENLPGLILATTDQSIRSAIEDILLIAEFMPDEEIRDRQILYLPLGAT